MVAAAAALRVAVVCRHFHHYQHLQNRKGNICLTRTVLSATLLPGLAFLAAAETLRPSLGALEVMLAKACLFVACLCTSASAFRTLPSRPLVTFGSRSAVQHGLRTATVQPVVRTEPLQMQQFRLPNGGGGFELSSLIGPAIFAGLFFSGALGWLFNFVIGFQAPRHRGVPALTLHTFAR